MKLAIISHVSGMASFSSQLILDPLPECCCLSAGWSPSSWCSPTSPTSPTSTSRPRVQDSLEERCVFIKKMIIFKVEWYGAPFCFCKLKVYFYFVFLCKHDNKQFYKNNKFLLPGHIFKMKSTSPSTFAIQ